MLGIDVERVIHVYTISIFIIYIYIIGSGFSPFPVTVANEGCRNPLLNMNSTGGDWNPGKEDGPQHIYVRYVGEISNIFKAKSQFSGWYSVIHDLPAQSELDGSGKLCRSCFFRDDTFLYLPGNEQLHRL